MVVLRTLVLAWLGVLPAAWCLPQELGRSSSLRPISLAQDLSPKDLSDKSVNLHDLLQDDLTPHDELSALSAVAAAAAAPPAREVAGNFRSYDDSERALLRRVGGASPVLYQLPEALPEPTGAAGGFRDALLPALASDDAAGAADWTPIDPRYYILMDYLNHNNEDSTVDSARFNRLGRSRNPASLDSNNKVKKSWPNGLSRRRASGLSLSIDASMKVLREALYLEIARKKQRQQMQRARQNQALLTTIGKRDVQKQARESGMESDNRE
ncbi:uncharacterized protein LOC122257760 [Penaeus japonicus]|uniref:uncharacterized protein LOC122257760 n=1 Tax=Penaeus japonicus TaxID=27405 RepID=UPI001C711453|nr:uncharacterized protein LOC122257760 [Penaeus japonicus]XP_042879296.1 uncharacterized protein LOC122257760 [Penaeus japonicus]